MVSKHTRLEDDEDPLHVLLLTTAARRQQRRWQAINYCYCHHAVKWTSNNHATATYISYFLPSFILMLLLHSVPLNIIVHVFERVSFFYYPFLFFLLSGQIINLCNGISVMKGRIEQKQTQCSMGQGSYSVRYDERLETSVKMLKYLMFSRRWLWRMASSGMLRRVAVVRIDVLEDVFTSFLFLYFLSVGSCLVKDWSPF
jgi:hypothetical protein